jgi:hypothetical protein
MTEQNVLIHFNPKDVLTIVRLLEDALRRGDIRRDWFWGELDLTRLHCSALIRLTEEEQIIRAQKIAEETPPFEIKFVGAFLAHVARITEDQVYCIGLNFESSGLAQYRQRWLAPINSDEVRRKHVPYKGDGHMTLAYIQAPYIERVKQFVAKLDETCRTHSQQVLASEVWLVSDFHPVSGVPLVNFGEDVPAIRFGGVHQAQL